MNFTDAKTRGFAILMVFSMFISASVVMFADDSDAAVSTDAAGRTLESSYNTERIMTVGVGTLRWVCYFGHSDDVVCIDAGDANAASWNGKAYRSLFDFNQAGLVSQMSGANINPTESHVTTYGMAAHDHNGFSSANLEALNDWTAKPTVSIISKTVYNGFSNEMKSGLDSITKVVVIEEVDAFLDSNNNLSEGFNTNLGILAHVFNDSARADALKNSINGFVSDIKSLINGKTCKFEDAYVGSASQSGAKVLTWSVGDYVPFKLAGVKNGYENSSSIATDAGSEAMSKATPSVIFLDLSGTTKHLDSASESVLTYAALNKTPIYTVLPYFWFGFNFDNAIADAYLMVYACYDNVLTFDQCVAKIKAVYQAFFPEMTNGQTALDGFDSYYSTKGSLLTFDGQAYNYDSAQSKFVTIDRPAGDVAAPADPADPADPAGNDNKNDNTVLYIGAAAGALIVVALLAIVLIKRK